MFGRVSAFVVAHRWWVIAAWVLAAIAIVPFSPRLGDVTNSNEASFLPGSYESAQADALARAAFPDRAGATALLVFSRQDGTRLTALDQSRIGSAVQGIGHAGIERVTSVQVGQRSPDGLLELAPVRFAGSSGDPAVLDAAGTVRHEATQRLEGTGLRAGLTGEAAIKLDDHNAHATAEKTVGIATIALILALLLLVFRSPVAALLPLASIALVFLTASSLIALAATHLGFDVSLDLPPLLTVVLFGIGTDYILFTLFRYREHLRAGARGRAAVVHATARVAEVITFAAFV
ncbi:MAG: MMPL family transporter, partial [Jatrophihabitans sp.]